MRNRKQIVLTTAVCGCFSIYTGSSCAMEIEGNEYALPEVVVTATRTENRRQDLPPATQVLTREDIERTGSRNLRELLMWETNIVQKANLAGGTGIVIRGMDTSKSLLLINGRRVANEASASGLGNAKAFDRINVHEVERVEIVRGPFGALYGSEAMGGVINIITRGAETPQVTTGVTQSLEDVNHWWHFDTGNGHAVSATLDVNFNKNRRDKEAGSALSDGYGTAQTYNFALDYALSDKQKVGFFYDDFSQHLKRDGDTPVLEYKSVKKDSDLLTGYAQVEGMGYQDFTQRTVGVAWNGKTERHNWEIRAYESRFAWDDGQQTKVTNAKIDPLGDDLSKKEFVEFVTASTSPLTSSDFNTDLNRLRAVEARDAIRINDNHRLTVGIEYTDNHVEGTNLGKNGENVRQITWNGDDKYFSEKDIYTYAAYVQDEIRLGKWFFVPALRYDHHSSFGSHVSPKLGVTYKATDTFRLKGNWGEGFEAPSVYRLYYNFRRVVPGYIINLEGNPDLQPQESKSFDIGFEKDYGRGSLSFAYFDNRVDNMIEAQLLRREGTEQWHRYINIGKARIRGAESTFLYRLSDRWAFKVSSTWLDAKDERSGKRLEQRPEFTQTYQLIYDDHKENGWNVTMAEQVDYRYLAGEVGSGGATGTLSYGVLHLAVTKRFGENTRIFGTILNVLDKEDDRADLYGRFWSIGMEHRF